MIIWLYGNFCGRDDGVWVLFFPGPGQGTVRLRGRLELTLPS